MPRRTRTEPLKLAPVGELPVPVDPFQAEKDAIKQAERTLDLETAKFNEMSRPVDLQRNVRENAKSELEKAQEGFARARSAHLLEIIEANPILLDVLAPDHTRRSCGSGTDNSRECPRCFLQDAVKHHFVDMDVQWAFKIENV